MNRDEEITKLLRRIWITLLGMWGMLAGIWILLRRALLVCALIAIPQVQAGEISAEITKSCYRNIELALQAENCVVIQKDAARYVIRMSKSESTRKTILDCMDGMPYRSDWLFVKICFDMKLHNALYGLGD